ncbi:aquaporin family protein [Chromobacterium haemolyticum]|nr:aquaporin family protein [Chromobacterium haemolyticum]
MAVFVGVFSVAAISGAHLNPAVSVALAVAGKFSWAKVPGYVLAQMLGGMTGAGLMWLIYRKHFDSTDCADTKLATFCTGPAIRSLPGNLVSEIVATFVLVFAILSMVAPQMSLGAIDALPVALLVLGIGVSLGGTTGYAMSPARDLAPRIMHAILPIPGKRARQRLGLCLGAGGRLPDRRRAGGLGLYLVIPGRFYETGRSFRAAAFWPPRL